MNMINRRDLLIKIGKCADPSKVIADIEKRILEAAEKGEDHIDYVLPDNFYCYSGRDVTDRSLVIKELEDNDYIVNCNTRTNTVLYDTITTLTIYW